jgi:hypothetical protein
MMMWIEAGLALILVIMSMVCPRLGANWSGSAERLFTGLAHRQRLSVIVVGVVALAARAAVLPILPEPQPYINDEFSYLLAADTFAHGRLTNPPHPLWIHLESLYEIQQPTYASKYPPAQGLILAAGQSMTGHPFVGVWLSVALMCAALCWMLQGWFSPPWALLGGLLVVMHFGVFSYWANSYWGGAVAATGGAMVMGAFPRIMTSQRVGDAVLMGLGLAILANSRPYEGLIFCLPVAAALIAWMWRGPRPPLRVMVGRVVAPMGLVLSLGALFTCYYFWRVTGSPFRMPYQVERATYAVAPQFIWQSPFPEPVYHLQMMHDFYNHNELDFYQSNRSAIGIMGVISAKFIQGWTFFLGPLLTLPFLMALGTLPMGFSWRCMGRQTRFLLLAMGVSFLGLAGEVVFFPHYAAPLTCLVFALLLVAMRRMRKWQSRGRPSGQFMLRALPVVCAFLLALRAAAVPLHLPLTPDWPPTWYNGIYHHTDRARILAQLEAYPGKQLVMVRYLPHSQAFPVTVSEWVHNPADIDQSKVVWAQDMGAARNQELINYFKDRKVWLVEPDQATPKLEPYTGAEEAGKY